MRLKGEGHAAQLVLKALPASQADRAQHHNALMTVCGVQLREVIDIMQKAIKKRDGGCAKQADGAGGAEVVSNQSRSPRKGAA